MRHCEVAGSAPQELADSLASDFLGLRLSSTACYQQRRRHSSGRDLGLACAGGAELAQLLLWWGNKGGGTKHKGDGV